MAEDAARTVALIEAGPPDRAAPLAGPGAAARVAFDPRYGWGYMTEPQPALNGRRQSLAEARVLGGGSSINGMVYTRGAASDYDAWALGGATGWSYAEVLPGFAARSAAIAQAARGMAMTGRSRPGAAPLRSPLRHGCSKRSAREAFR